VLERYRSKSTVVNPNISNVDVFSLVRAGNLVYVNFIKVVDGAIVQSHTIEVQTRLDESDQDILGIAITEFRQRYESDAGEIILPLKPGFEIPGLLSPFRNAATKNNCLNFPNAMPAISVSNARNNAIWLTRNANQTNFGNDTKRPQSERNARKD
jgi:excinuclease UvrABC nuclease subunit